MCWGSSLTTNSGPARKGSRPCLQEYVNNRQAALNDLVLGSSATMLALGPASIEWLSPLRPSYQEYRDGFLDVLGLGHFERALREFWPAQGPQWDGLAKLYNKAGDMGVLLVEAKAHPAETESSLMATAPASLDKINRALARTQGHMGVTQADWTQGAYQLANPLAFLYFMNELIGVPTYLALVNFVGDTSYKPTDLPDWHQHYWAVFERLGLRPSCRMLDRVIMIYPPAP